MTIEMPTINPFANQQAGAPEAPKDAKTIMLEALKDTAAGRISNGEGVNGAKRKAAQEHLRNYVHGNLHAQRDHSPGLRQTNFKHVFAVHSSEAACQGPDDPSQAGIWHTTDIETEYRRIAQATIDHSEGRVPTCHTCTIDELMRGDPPTELTFDVAIPARGFDGHGNAAFVLHGFHPAMPNLINNLFKEKTDTDPSDGTHHQKVAIKNDDNLSWMRAAWLSALMQTDPEALKTTLEAQFKKKDPFGRPTGSLGPEDTALVGKIVGMAKALQVKDGIHLLQQKDASGKTMPISLTMDGFNLDEQLANLTGRMLTGKKDGDKKDIWAELCKGGEVTGAHVFSLINALGGVGAIRGEEIRDPNAPEASPPVSRRSVAISTPTIVDLAGAKLDANDEQGHANFAYDWLKTCPILERDGDFFHLRIPDMEVATRQDAQKAADAQAAEQNRHGPDNLGKSDQGNAKTGTADDEE